MQNELKITVIEPITSQLQADTTNVAEKIRVAAYARVSTEQDEQQNSYEAQVSYYTHFINSNPDWEFVGIFSDEGITGTNTKKRNGFNQMVDIALSGGIDLILTKSISRFARNTVDALQVVRKLRAMNIEVWFEKENLHTLDPKCEMLLTIMSSLAQEESRSISENVRWGQRRSMEKGNVNIPYKHFLGYRKGADGRPEIVEEEAVVIRRIYKLFLDGYTINDIAKKLTAEGVSTPTGRAKWSVSTVRSILTNEKYRGDALLQKTYIADFLTKEKRKNHGEIKQYLVENSHDPIIDPETFDRVQTKIARFTTNRRFNHSSSPFANCLVCGDCGEYYGHKVWHNDDNSKRYDVWYCNHRYGQEKKCQSPIIREPELYKAFEKALYAKDYKDSHYTETGWREMIESATVTSDGQITFHFKDGTAVPILLGTD